jgi:hypothetical protein
MGIIDIDPKILNDLSTYISDIQVRTQSNISEIARKGAQLVEMITIEVRKRQIRVEELTQQYDACCRSENSDCSEFRRMLTKARLSLEAALRAKHKTETALLEYKTKSNSTEERVSSISVAGKNTIKKLQNNLDDYSAFSGLVAASLLNAVYGGSSSSIEPGNKSTFRSLNSTRQSYCKAKTGNKDILVFDHPKESAKNAVINQGSANPGQIEGTCGLCATGTIIRKAGANASEKSMISYATTNGLCSTGKSPERNGGTSPAQLVALLQGFAGLNAKNEYGKSLEELTTAVEKGQGVVVGVNPSIFNPKWYGEYNPNDNGGHWVVLESIVRDASSNKILGYVILDSNGDSSRTACQTIKAALLEDAYYMDGADSVITTDIIW